MFLRLFLLLVALTTACGRCASRGPDCEAQAGVEREGCLAGRSAQSAGSQPEQASACGSMSGDLRDSCLLQLQPSLADAPVALQVCQAISADQTYAACVAAYALHHRVVTSLDVARDLCGRVAEGSWRDECYFGLSESILVDHLDLRLEVCEQAGSFRGRCATHLLRTVALTRASKRVLGSFADAVGDIHADCAELAPRVAGEVLPVKGMARRCNIEGLQALLAEGATSGQLNRWVDLGSALDDGQETFYRRLHAEVWVRANLRKLGTKRAPPLSIMEERYAKSVAAGAGKQVSPTASPLVENPRDLLGPKLDHFHLWTIPVTLMADPSCGLTETEGQRIALLWGLVAARWSKVSAALGEALSDDSVNVRAFALWVVDDKMSARDKAGTHSQEWLEPALKRLAEEDPDPWIKERATHTLDVLAGGEVPEGWSDQRPAACVDGTSPDDDASATGDEASPPADESE